MKTFGPILLFTIAFLLFFVGIGMYVDRISGTKPIVIGDLPISVESGQTIFWGKGTCSNCHKVGSEGSNTRCPDLGGIGERAATRANEINTKRKAEGKPADYNGNKYLMESIAEPKAYVVAGTDPIMPNVYETVPLNRREVLSVLMYLQAQGGEEDREGLEKYIEMIPEKSIPPEEKGRELFFDTKSDAACIRCHKIEGKGEAEVGPDLTGIGTVQTSAYLLESILFSSKVIVSGYEQYILRDEDERIYSGLVYRSSDNKKWNPGDEVEFEDWLDDEDSVYIIDSNDNKSESIAKDEIYEDELETGPIKQKLSMMPGDFSDKLTMQQMMDIVAYLVSQK